MILSVLYIQERIAHFNSLIFRGELPPIPVKLVRARTFLGKIQYKRIRKPFARGYAYRDYLMKISVLHDFDETLLDNVVVHEMIHYYIAYNGIKDSSAHGEMFCKMMNEINIRYGLQICISHRFAPSERQPDLRVREHVVCVSRMASGEYGITVCSRVCAPKIRRDLPRYYRPADMRWYVTNNPFFNKYPHSRSAKIYKITEEELQSVGLLGEHGSKV